MRKPAIAILLIFSFCLSARPAAWPTWRGPERNGKTPENSGFTSDAWPLKEPAWEATVGIGCASMIVNDSNELFTLGWNQGQDVLTCLSAATGSIMWRQTYSTPDYGRHSKGDKGFYRGPSSTPEFDEATGRIYTLGLDGDLNCWNARKQGDSIWSLNLYDQFAAPVRPQATSRRGSHRDYGYPGSPLAYRDWLLVEVGAPAHGNLIAFDKATGKVAWKSQNRDPAGHSGAVALMEVEGVPCALTLTARNLVVTRLDSGHEGQEVARHEWTTDFINNIATPAVDGNRVIITSQYNKKAVCCLEISLDGARKIWEVAPGSGVCTPIIHQQRVYFVDRGLHCLDFNSGKLLWRGGKFGRTASILMTGDDKLLVWANNGDLALIDPAANEYTELSSTRDVHSSPAWPHVVLADGRLFCKDSGGNLKAFSLK